MTTETQVKERPIIFSGEMVRAILDGRKTQTRRVIKPQAETYCTKCKECTSICSCPFGEGGKGEDAVTEAERCTRTKKHIPENCPYGIPGDRLWCRETFAIQNSIEVGEMMPFDDGRPHLDVDGGVEHGTWWEQPHYRATDPEPELCYDDKDGPCVRWKPSIHMPRWASRILLEVTDIRVERVQDISTNDVSAEGIDRCEIHRVSHVCCSYLKKEFEKLWNSINEKRGFGWDVNPWVWVVSFKEIKYDH